MLPMHHAYSGLRGVGVDTRIRHSLSGGGAEPCLENLKVFPRNRTGWVDRLYPHHLRSWAKHCAAYGLCGSELGDWKGDLRMNVSLGASPSTLCYLDVLRCLHGHYYLSVPRLYRHGVAAKSVTTWARARQNAPLEWLVSVRRCSSQTTKASVAVWPQILHHLGRVSSET